MSKGRHAFSGYNDEALTTTVKSISSDGDFSTKGQVFWLRGVTLTNEHATQTGLIDLYDQDEAAATAANQRAAIQVEALTTVVVEFSAPGIPFKTELGAVATNGTFNAYTASCWGYLE